jgi:hypothetical protein
MFAQSMVQLPNSDLQSALSLLLRLWQTVQTLLPTVAAPVHVQLISTSVSALVQSELTSLSSDIFMLALKTKLFDSISPVLAAPVLSVRPDVRRCHDIIFSRTFSDDCFVCFRRLESKQSIIYYIITMVESFFAHRNSISALSNFF